MAPRARGPSSSPEATCRRLDREDGRLDRRRDVAALEKVHTPGVAMTRRSGVEDDASADRRLAAQDDPIASCGDDRGCEAELSPALADPHDTRRHVARPEVHVESRAVRDRLELVERDVEPVRHRIRAGRDERLAALDLPALDPGQADGDTLTRIRT